MRLTLLKCKLHRARVTHSELEYEGSCAIDIDLLKRASLHEYEQIEIYNVTNGERFTTYVISAEAGSGIISVNGAAAHKAQPDDIIIICAYAQIEDHEVADFNPQLVYLDELNRVIRTGHQIATQVVDTVRVN